MLRIFHVVTHVKESCHTAMIEYWINSHILHNFMCIVTHMNTYFNVYCYTCDGVMSHNYD